MSICNEKEVWAEGNSPSREREAAGVWDVKCANGVTHLVLIKDLAMSQPLPSDLPLREHVKGSPRTKCLGRCVQTTLCGREEERREMGQEGERDRKLPSLEQPSVAGTVLGAGWGGAVLSGGGGGLLSRPLQ